MGVYKGLYLQKTNRKVVLRIKSYSYYRKDIWGLLRWKKLFKHKKAVYNILKIIRKFYNIILQQVYKGVHFNVKRYGYIGTLFFTKRLLRLYYGNLRESYFGRLGRLVKRKSGILINYFFSLLERRLDVLLVRTFFTNKVIWARRYIIFVNVFVSKLCVSLPNFRVRVGDIVTIKSNPEFFGFFSFDKHTFSVKDFRGFKKYRGIFKKIRLNSLNFVWSRFRRIFLTVFRGFLKHSLFYRFFFLKKRVKKTFKFVKKNVRLLKRVLCPKKISKRYKKSFFKSSNFKKGLERKHSKLVKRYKQLIFRYLGLVKWRYYKFKRFFLRGRGVLKFWTKNGFRFFFKNIFGFMVKFIKRLRSFKGLGKLVLLKIFRKVNLLLQTLLSERHGDQNVEYLRCFFRAFLSRHLVFRAIGGSVPIQRRKFLLYWSSSFLRIQLLFMSMSSKNDYIYVRKFKAAYLRSFLLFRKLRVLRLLMRKFLFNRKYKNVKRRNQFKSVGETFSIYLSKNYKRYRFSLSQYKLLTRGKIFYISPVSPFLEVNYKLRKFVVFKIPSPEMLKYPFGVRTSFLYTYYKRRAFF